MRDDTYDTVEMLKRLGRQVSRLGRESESGESPTIIIDITETEGSADSIPSESMSDATDWSWGTAWGFNSW